MSDNTSVHAVISRAVATALSDVGYKEGKGNANEFAAMVDAPNYAAYCAIGAHSAYQRAGVNTAKAFTTPWFVPGMWSQAKAKGWASNSPEQDGDFVIYDWQGDTRDGDHIGIALPSKGDGHAVEYNTSKGTAGSQSNGDGVYERDRKSSTIIGYIRIRRVLAALGIADATSPATGPVIRSGDHGSVVIDVQRMLNAKGARVAEDGSFGPRTEAAVKAVQRAYHLTIDGVVGPQTFAALRSPNPPIRARVRKGDRGGDVTELQRLVGVAPDGIAGPKTDAAIRSAQTRAGLKADGVAGPDTWSALIGVRVAC